MIFLHLRRPHKEGFCTSL